MKKENSNKKRPFLSQILVWEETQRREHFLISFTTRIPSLIFPVLIATTKKIPKIWYHLDRFIGTILGFLLYSYVKLVQFCVCVGQWFNLRGNTKRGTLLDFFHHKNPFSHLSYPYRQDHKNPTNWISLGPLPRPGPLGDPKASIDPKNVSGVQLTF